MQPCSSRRRESIEIGDDSGNWYFVAGDTPVAKAPGDTGAPIGQAREGRRSRSSVMHPPATNGAAAPVPTHYEVLLPSGTTGWIAARAARPLAGNRLCYAKAQDGRWTIVNFDQGQDD